VKEVDYMELRERLTALRAEKGIKQAELAKILNYGSTAISNYESGRNEPCVADLKKIAAFYDVSMDYLCCVNDIRNPYIPTDEEMPDEAFLTRYRRLNDEGRNLLGKIAKCLVTEFGK